MFRCVIVWNILLIHVSFDQHTVIVHSGKVWQVTVRLLKIVTSPFKYGLGK
jgi:hypothetical protein